VATINPTSRGIPALYFENTVKDEAIPQFSRYMFLESSIDFKKKYNADNEKAPTAES
jgi:hypothetical protein